MQLHVELEDRQYREFQLALKKLGYRTVSEFIRQQVRAAIKQARLPNDLEVKQETFRDSQTR